MRVPGGRGAQLSRAEGGFSLIELLVVVVIISLLAAIGIPLFFAQRERAWVAQTESALRNAATAMDAAAVSSGGDYSSFTIPELVATEGLKYSTQVVDLVVESANVQGYCLSARHTISLETTYWDSAVGRPSATTCAGKY
jgi:prepilin-type N-terminal cleavage/methylation domain-containing protein